MIITNREEVIDKAFGVFVRMNYEKASIITLAKACGVTKTGIVYYFPHKLDLFMAVADKYVLQMHEPENKFAAPADTLTEFIGQYVAGVAASMKRIVLNGLNIVSRNIVALLKMDTDDPFTEGCHNLSHLIINQPQKITCVCISFVIFQ